MTNDRLLALTSYLFAGTVSEMPMPEIHRSGDAIRFGSSSISLGTHQPNTLRVKM